MRNNYTYSLLIGIVLSLAPFGIVSMKAQAMVDFGSIVRPTSFDNEAKAAEKVGNFNAALAYYQAILKDDPNRRDLYFDIAEAARQAKVYLVAERYFEKIVDNDTQKKYPSLNFKMGLVKQSLGKYDEAINLFNTYLTEKHSEADNFNHETHAQIAACNWAKTMLAKPVAVEVEHLDTKVNSIYTDLAPIQYGQTLYYTSAFFPKKSADPITHIFATDMKSEGKPIAENIDSLNIHTAHFTMNEEGTRMYFNICHPDKKNSNFRCEIWYRQRKNMNEKWSVPIRLPRSVNLDSFTATQPSVGRFTEGGDVLYFVSNRPDGKGGMDIWSAKIKTNGDVDEVRNEQSVNTEKDDITPFFYNGSQTLFFSSLGLKSMGGFDIYRAQRQGDGFGEAENVGSPINSSFDDIYYSLNQNNSRAYFTSNRIGGMCGSEEKDCVCNDIYSYEFYAEVIAKTYLRGTKETLSSCRVDLVDVLTKQVINTKTVENNTFSVKFGGLSLERDYMLVASKPNYTSDTVFFHTKNLFEPTVIERPLSLLPDLKLHIAIFDAINRKPLKGASVFIKDTKTGKVLVEKQLGGGYTLKYEPLNFGNKYYIYSSKESFQSDSSFVTTEVYGSNRVDYYDTLYLTPFTGLPVVLYFDNDHPNPRTTTPVTKLSYGETFTSYIGKQSEFFNAYYQGNQEVSADKANEISEFFTNDVQKGYDKLLNFSSLLFNYLEEGYNLEMVLEGYASPLAATDYNRNLTARRVSSVANHLFNFNGGILRKYLQNGQLRLKVEPYGETQAATSVSDDGLNRKLSVYSVAASRERRVQIKEVNRIESSKVEFNSDLYLNFSNYFGDNPTYKIFGGGSGLYNGITGNANVTQYSSNMLTAPTKKGKKSGKSQRKVTENYEIISYQNPVSVSSKHGVMMWEVVVVDAYSKMILPNAQVQILDQYNNTRIKAKRKGNGYMVKMNDGEEYRAKVTAGGYSEGAANRMMSYTEGGATLTTDTVYLTPFNGLPLPLFFDNDRPNPRTNLPTTNANYDAEYKSFYARKKEFLRQINRLAGSSTAMNQFFEQEVKDGFERLSGFAKVMQQYLAKGHQIEVVLEGYASPLAGSDYNVNLANRRVQSVINYFKNYQGFSYYLDTQKLKLTIEPFGEANSTASDDAKDTNAIYGLEASKARKVVIKDIILRD